MPSGRCAGCGLTDSCRKVSMHILTCEQYGELHRSAPHKCLDPAAEHARYQSEDNNPEARAQRRDERLTHRFAEVNRQVAASVARWKRPPGLLDD